MNPLRSLLLAIALLLPAAAGAQDPIATARAAIEAAPDPASAATAKLYVQLGDAQRAAGDPTGAIASYEAAVGIYEGRAIDETIPVTPCVHAAAAAAWIDAGDPIRARRAWDRAFLVLEAQTDVIQYPECVVRLVGGAPGVVATLDEADGAAFADRVMASVAKVSTDPDDVELTLINNDAPESSKAFVAAWLDAKRRRGWRDDYWFNVSQLRALVQSRDQSGASSYFVTEIGAVARNFEGLLGPDHPRTAEALYELGTVAWQLDLPSGPDILEESARRYRKGGVNAVGQFGAWTRAARAWQDLGDGARAYDALQQALSAGTQALPFDAREHAWEVLIVASRQGSNEVDQPARIRALNTIAAKAWPDATQREERLAALAQDPNFGGLLAPLIEEMKSQSAMDTLMRFGIGMQLAEADALAKQGKAKKAVKLEIPALEQRLAYDGVVPYLQAANGAVRTHRELDQWAAAAQVLEQMTTVVEGEKGVDHRHAADYHRHTATAYVSAGRADLAAPHLDRAIEWGAEHWQPDEASMESAARTELTALRQAHLLRKKHPEEADAIARSFEQAASRIWPDPVELGQYLVAGSMILAIEDPEAAHEIGHWMMSPSSIAMPPSFVVYLYLQDAEGKEARERLRGAIERWRTADRHVAGDLLALGASRVAGKEATTWAAYVHDLAAGVLAEDPGARALILRHLSVSLHDAGKLELAATYAEEAVTAGQEAALPADRMAALWQTRGLTLRKTGDATGALAAYRAADAAAIAAYGADSRERVPHAADLAVGLAHAGLPDEAVPLVLEAVKNDMAHGGPTWATAEAWMAAAAVLELGGYPEESQQLVMQAKARLMTQVPDGPELATSLASEAHTAVLYGRYGEARDLLDRAGRIAEDLQPPDPSVSAAVDEALATVLLETGDPAGAALAARRAEDASAQLQDSDGVARALLLQGRAALASGDLAKADDLLAHARSAATDDSGQGRAQLHVAELRIAQGRPAEALAIYDDLASRNVDTGSALSVIHIGVARSKAALAAGDAKTAYAAAHEATLLARGVIGTFSEGRGELIESWVAEARALHALGETAKARASLEQASTAAERSLKDALAGGASERERMAVLRAQRALLDDTLVYGAADDAGAWSAVLDWKGAVAQALLAERAALARTKDPETKRLAAELQEVRAGISAAAYAATPSAEGLAKLTRRKEELEKALSAALAQSAQQPPPSAAAVCAALPEGAVLVDYLRYGTRYTAFVVAKDCKPKRVDLGSADAIESAVAAYRATIETGARRTAEIDGAAAKVRALVWDPLGVTSGTVLLVPDAALNGVAFAGLPLADGKYLVEKVTIGHLDNAREVVRLAEPARGLADRALLVGGVDYDLAGTEARPTQIASRGASCMGGTFPALAATGPEAESVAGLVKGRVKGVDLLRGADATEGRVSTAAADARYIHLATHGFFATGSCASALGETRGVKVASGSAEATATPALPSGAGFNPMVLSGLVLAGANPRADGDRGDGIWTAEEAASLDLDRTELVVLSACETGLGEVASGEGVMGLRRAFAQAGARTLVLSLWTVEDDPTRVLMADLYGGLDKGKLAALREAQLALLAENRAAGDAKPWTWSAFIASGDWR